MSGSVAHHRLPIWRGSTVILASVIALFVGSMTASAQGRGADAIRNEDRFNALERQNAALTGQVEQLQFKVQQLQQQIERMQADYDFRLTQLEGRTGGQRAAAQPAPRPTTAPASPAAPSAPPPLQPGATIAPAPGTGSPAGAAAPPPAAAGGSQMASASAGQSAEQLYDAGFTQMQDKDYNAAERSFRSFLQSYPRHQLAGNAQFWIGEIYFVRKDYVNASIAYAEGYRSYPKGPKGPENLYQLGRSLALTNQVREACTIWDKLGREYPNASEIIRVRTAQERQRYRCA